MGKGQGVAAAAAVAALACELQWQGQAASPGGRKLARSGFFAIGQGPARADRAEQGRL